MVCFCALDRIINELVDLFVVGEVQSFQTVLLRKIMKGIEWMVLRFSDNQCARDRDIQHALWFSVGTLQAKDCAPFSSSQEKDCFTLPYTLKMSLRSGVIGLWDVRNQLF